ncbi:MAG TPA: cell division protein CrgA [Actinomycetota bacterium]|nr:cell division protein CrgA [Actinomycetota bacterium]
MPKSRAKRQVKQPPPKAKPKRSPEWVGILFFLLLGAGVVTIIGNYLSLFPNGVANWRLFYGLGLVSGSFIVATRWH